jgi:hypothetical protein
MPNCFLLLSVVVHGRVFKAEIVRCTFDDEAACNKQRLFVCIPCSKNARIGLCEACFLICHDSCVDGGRERVVQRDFYDIGEKRNFRCDCGTARSKHECVLKMPTKYLGSLSVPAERFDAERERATNLLNNETNANNKYTQNFDGLYCWCKQPWIADSEEAVEMRQCQVRFVPSFVKNGNRFM